MIEAEQSQQGVTARLAELLGDEQAFAGFERFVAQLPELNATIELLTGFLGNAPNIAENANGIIGTAREAMNGHDLGASVDRVKSAAETGGTLIDELGPSMTDPASIESLKKLLEMLPRMVAILQMAEQFIEGASRFADNVNGIVTTARHAGGWEWLGQLNDPAIAELPAKVLEIVNSHSLQNLLASRVLSDGALHVMDQVAAATVEAHAKTVAQDTRVSRFGAFKALGDEDVQRGLAFTIELGRCIGAYIREQPHATPTAER